MFLYVVVFSCLSFVLAQKGSPLHTGAVGPFLVLCLVLYFVSYALAIWFLHGKDTSLASCFMLECLVSQICQILDFNQLVVGFGGMTSDTLMTFFG